MILTVKISSHRTVTITRATDRATAQGRMITTEQAKEVPTMTEAEETREKAPTTTEAEETPEARTMIRGGKAREKARMMTAIGMVLVPERIMEVKNPIEETGTSRTEQGLKVAAKLQLSLVVQQVSRAFTNVPFQPLTLHRCCSDTSATRLCNLAPSTRSIVLRHSPLQKTHVKRRARTRRRRRKSHRSSSLSTGALREECFAARRAQKHV